MSCGLCRDGGIIVAIPKAGEWGQFGFRCGCPIGRAKWCTGIPLWNSHYAKSYEVSHLMIAPKDPEPTIEETPPVKAPEDLF